MYKANKLYTLRLLLGRGCHVSLTLPPVKARWGRETRSRAGSDPTGGPQGRARQATQTPYGIDSRARGFPSPIGSE